MTVNVRFLYYRECPSYDMALALLHQVLAETQQDASIQVIEVTTEEEAQRLRFPGSPTIIIQDHDIAPPDPQARYALTCRAYQHEDGRITPLPSADMIRRALHLATQQVPNRPNIHTM